MRTATSAARQASSRSMTAPCRAGSSAATWSILPGICRSREQERTLTWRFPNHSPQAAGAQALAQFPEGATATRCSIRRYASHR